MLHNLENKLSVLHDEKEFYSKEIKNAKKYNMYLKWKLETLEENKEENNSMSMYKDRKNESSIDESYNNNYNNKLENEKKEREGIEKLQNFFSRNEEIYQNKINHEQKKIKEKYEKLKKLENFNNPIFQILSSKYKDYQNNMFNSLVSNQEIFFNNKNDSGSERMNKVRIKIKFF